MISGGRDRVAEPHPGERRDLRERPRDDHRAPFEHVRHRRRVVRIVDEVVIRLVDQHRHVLRDAVEQLLHFLLRHDDAGRVVRVAQIDQPDLARVIVRGLDHRRDVLAIVLAERQLDRGRLDARRVLVDRAVGRLDAEHLLAVLQERGADDVERFAGAGRQQDALILDAVMLRDFLEDVAVRVAVAVGVLPGVVHRLHHRLGRAVVVLVARQLRERVVVVHRAPGPRRGTRGALRLREQVDVGPNPQVTDGGGDATDEIPARNTHRSSVLVVNE